MNEDENFKHFDNIKIEGFKFPVFDGSKEESEVRENIIFPELKGQEFLSPKQKSKILKFERTLEAKSDFKISPIVKEYRGLKSQEHEEREIRVEEEVGKRVFAVEKDAFQKGFEEGVKRGREEVLKKTILESQEKIASLSDMISEVLSLKSELFEKHKKEIFAVVRDLTKWIILRELKDDGTYLERLLEKLILEMQAKTNLIIQVNEKEFETMPEILESIQQKLGELTNVRVLVDYNIQEKGIVLESENGIIRANISEQFEVLDKLFHGVGLINEEEPNDDGQTT